MLTYCSVPGYLHQSSSKIHPCRNACPKHPTQTYRYHWCDHLNGSKHSPPTLKVLISYPPPQHHPNTFKPSKYLQTPETRTPGQHPAPELCSSLLENCSKSPVFLVPLQKTEADKKNKPHPFLQLLYRHPLNSNHLTHFGTTKYYQRDVAESHAAAGTSGSHF